MRLLLSALTVFIIYSCGSNGGVLEERVKNYMGDTIVPRLNDPSSYEFVSMKIDTFTGKDDYDDLKRLSTDTALFDSSKRNEMKNELVKIESDPRYMDSVFKYFIIVDYRAKNKLGAKALTSQKMWYYPNKDAIQPVWD